MTTEKEARDLNERAYVSGWTAGRAEGRHDILAEIEAVLPTTNGPQQALANRIRAIIDKHTLGK